MAGGVSTPVLPLPEREREKEASCGRSSVTRVLAAEMITRFLGLGFTLPPVVTMCTENPARAIGAEHRLGSRAVGRQADISVLEIRNGDWVVRDVVGGSLRVDRAVVPFLTVKKGRVLTPDWGPRAWGWEPDRVLPAGGGGCC